MISEYKQYHVKCDYDGCDKMSVFLNKDEHLEKCGWTLVTSHGWGMTGYSKTEHFCPIHSKKLQKEE